MLYYVTVVMACTTVSVSLPLAVYVKCVEHGINRSGIARRAIEAEIERLENEAREQSAKTNPGISTSFGGHQNVTR